MLRRDWSVPFAVILTAVALVTAGTSSRTALAQAPSAAPANIEWSIVPKGSSADGTRIQVTF